MFNKSKVYDTGTGTEKMVCLTCLLRFISNEATQFEHTSAVSSQHLSMFVYIYIMKWKRVSPVAVIQEVIESDGRSV